MQCVCPEPGGHLAFRQHRLEDTTTPHFAKAGFLLSLCGGVEVVVSDRIEKYSCLDMLKWIITQSLSSLFSLLCQKVIKMMVIIIIQHCQKDFLKC